MDAGRVVSRLSPDTIAELEAWAKARQHDEALEIHRARRFDGTLEGAPELHLEDVSDIPGVSGVPGVASYQHRARVRARGGDLYAAVLAPPAGYEVYNRELLDFAGPEFVLAEPGTAPLAVAEACRRGEAFEQICSFAQRQGGLVVHPYMGIESVWRLADDVHGATGVPVQVLGPPPPATWVANDKVAFDAVVALTLGADWLVESIDCVGFQATVEALETLATRHQVVGLKRLRSASAMGNRVVRQRHLETLGAEALVRDFLAETAWCGDDEVQVVAWLESELSPSTQLWIPPLGQGAPRVDGVYEQLLLGDEKVFLGSRPARFDAQVVERMKAASLLVAEAFQRLGYCGRCSFDLLVVGDGDIYFTECNGRWGGTSTPMHLVDRLFPAERPFYRAQDYMNEALVGMPFEALFARFGDALYDHRSGRGRYVLYNVGPLADRGKFDVIALGQSQDEVDRAIELELPSLLGL
ncbi:MAG TPA: hypothetical protein DEB46_03075 [Myxococcales bacterium]|nr:hypothetical protein [Myxococcales bacterium]